MEATELNDLFKKMHQSALDKGWYEDKGSMADIYREGPPAIALIHSEVSEALEDIRTGTIHEAVTVGGKPIGFPSELADIIIRVGDLAGRHGIDLGGAILRKMAYNQTRSHRHGGKAL